MIGTIVKKDLRCNFQELRIQILTAAMLTLTLVATTLGIFEYKERLDRYQVDQQANLSAINENQVYATLAPEAIRPPEPLSILCKGVESDFGHIIPFNLSEIPYEAENSQGTYPYASEFVKMDVSKILIWLLSLIGLLVSYDAISREGEDGTIRLILSGQIARTQFFWSKFLACTLTVTLPLLAAFLLVSVIFIATPWVELNASVVAGILTYFVVAFLYALIWVGLGIVISLFVNSSATALIVSLAVWVMWMIAIPGLMKVYVGPTHFNAEKTEVRSLQQEVISEYWEEYRRVWVATLDPLIAGLKFRTMGGGPGGEPIVGANPETMAGIKNFYQSLNPLRLDTGERKFRIAEAHFIQPYREKVHLSNQLAHMSPSTLLELLFMKVAKTSYEDYFRYFDQAIQYRNQILDYFRNKDAFRTIRWFTPEPEFNPAVPGHSLYPVDPENPTTGEWNRLMQYYQSLDTDPKYKLRLSDFPPFNFKANGTTEILNDILPSLIIIILGIGLFIILGLLRAERYNIT